MAQPLDVVDMAKRIAFDIEDGFYVNLGIGLPTTVANYILSGRLVIFQSENGILGLGPHPEEGKGDKDISNAGGEDVTVVNGASFFNSAESFAMIRGGHVDVSVLGGFQVSEKGDLANWKLPSREIGSCGGGMDLAACAKKLYVMMKHSTKGGEARIVKKCDYPLTAKKCVDTIVTDIALIDVIDKGLVLREVAPGFTPEEIQKLTEPKLIMDDVKEWSNS